MTENQSWGISAVWVTLFYLSLPPATGECRLPRWSQWMWSHSCLVDDVSLFIPQDEALLVPPPVNSPLVRLQRKVFFFFFFQLWKGQTKPLLLPPSSKKKKNVFNLVISLWLAHIFPPGQAECSGLLIVVQVVLYMNLIKGFFYRVNWMISLLVLRTRRGKLFPKSPFSVTHCQQ